MEVGRGGPGGTGTEGTANASVRTGLPRAENDVVSPSGFFFVRRSSFSTTRRFRTGDFRRANSASKDWVMVLVFSFSPRFLDICGGGPNIFE